MSQRTPSHATQVLRGRPNADRHRNGSRCMQIRCCPVAENPLTIVKFVEQAVVAIGNGDTGRAALPNPHQPDRIESAVGDTVPDRRGHGCQVNIKSVFLAQLEQSQPDIDFVDGGILALTGRLSWSALDSNKRPGSNR